jgi:hypothetical protein
VIEVSSEHEAAFGTDAQQQLEQGRTMKAPTPGLPPRTSSNGSAIEERELRTGTDAATGPKRSISAPSKQPGLPPKLGMPSVSPRGGFGRAAGDRTEAAETETAAVRIAPPPLRLPFAGKVEPTSADGLVADEDGSERQDPQIDSIARVLGNAKPKRLLAATTMADAWDLLHKASNELPDADAFEVVRAARTQIKSSKIARRARGDTTASPDSIGDYRRKCLRIDKELVACSLPAVDALAQAVARHAPVKQSFQKMKSAIRTETLSRVEKLLQVQDEQQARKADPFVRRQWHVSIRTLAWAVDDLRIVDALDRGECLDEAELTPQASKSKRALLRKLDVDWRDRFMAVNERSAKYRHAGVVLRHCGVRPEELRRGISVRWAPKGIRVFVRGAKVRATAGQPWRSFILDTSCLPKWFVDEVRERRRVVVTAKPDALRQHLSRLSQVVLNPKDAKKGHSWKLSAYLFRHALVTDLRESDWVAEEIAAVIGEGSAATVSWYGLHKGSGGARPPAVARGRTSVARAVRPLDRSYLKQLSKKTKKTRK